MRELDRSLHLDDETLASLADGGLDPFARDAAEAHVADCGECRAAWLEVADVASGTPSPAPAGLADRVLARLPLEAGAPPAPREGAPVLVLPASRASGLAWAVAASVLLAASVGGAFVLASGASTRRAGEEPTFAGLAYASPAAPGTTVAPAPLPDLGKTGRWLAHLSTDKPVYRPGERLFARAVVLDAFDRSPAEASLQATVEVRSGRGEVVHRQSATTADGVAAFGWEIPEGLAGGTFTVAATSASFPATETTVDVRDHRLPRIRADLDFLRKAYGPGETVTATLEAARAEGGAPAGATVTAVAIVDGTEVARKTATLDEGGRCLVTFDLPKEIAAGDGTLAATIVDGAVTDTTAKTIPIVVARVALSLYPEGGDLVAGVPNRVYFEARTPRQAPADVAGRVLDEKGAVVARLRSEHEGRGRFDIVPRAGATYRVALDEPAGVPTEYALPAVAPTGFAIASLADSPSEGEAVHVSVASPIATHATVGLYARERELARVAVRLQADRPVAVALLPRVAASGVLRATVFDAEGNPRAERLVFRRPAQSLDVTLVPTTRTTTPRGKVTVDVVTKDLLGRPVAAIVGLAATDEQALTIPEPRERPARLPASALLGAEVSELKDPSAYLGSDAASARKTDLLLGTQGWRRFAFFAAEAQHIDLVTGDVLFDEGFPVFGAVGEEAAAPFLAWGRAGFGSPDRFRVGPLIRQFSPTVSPLSLRYRGPTAPSVTGLAFASAVDGSTAQLFEFSPFHRMRAQDGATWRANGFWLMPLPSGQATNANWNGTWRNAGIYFNDGKDGDVRARTEAVFARALRDVEIAQVRQQLHRKGISETSALQALVKEKMQRRSELDRFGFHTVEILEPATPVGPPAPAWVRVYAHAAAEAKTEAERQDFEETVYWNAALSTGADGRGSFTFAASDSVTTLHVRADAVSRAGALGVGDARVEVRRPFHLEPKLPLEVTAGDRIDLPVALVNGTASRLAVRLGVEAGTGLRVASGTETSFDVAADGSARGVVVLDVEPHAGPVKVVLDGKAEPASDKVTREVRVVPAGFPFAKSAGGVLDGTVEREVEVPADFVAGSLETEAVVYPSPLASFSKAVGALLQEPGGCFEQTSSTNYPNVMALRYLKSHPDSDPAIVKEAAGLAERGYRRLVSFECKKSGYEWFGNDPGHEGLTAYGLLEFADMAPVTPVDADMVARTRAWLLSRRDGKGGFQDRRGLHDFGRAPKDLVDAYVTWALARAGEKDLGAEVARVRSIASTTKDPYVLALCAHVLLGAGEREPGTACLAALAAKQDETGAVRGAATSITMSGGESLLVETTSLAVLAWLRAPEFGKNVDRAMAWIASACQGGRFGSTQGTVLALDAIAAYDATRTKTKAAGAVTLSVDGEVVGKVAFPAGKQGAVALPGFAARMTGGKHVVRLSLEGGAPMTFGVTLKGHLRTPPSSPRAQVEITTSLSRAEAAEGDPVDVAVAVENRTGDVLPMVVAIVGLPGGLEPRAEQLKELVKEGRVDAWEIRGREVVLYWTGMAAKGVNRVPVSCLAAVPGSYTGPASRAYLYYTDEDKDWATPLAVRIAR